MLKTSLVALMALFVVSCGNYLNEKGSPEPATNGGLGVPAKYGPSGEGIDFEVIKSEFLQESCTNCHTGRHQAYANYQVVRAAASAMLERMETNDASRLMPRGGPRLPAEKIAIFKAWIANGAPEKASSKPTTPGGNGGPTAAAIGFQDIMEGVLKPNNCIACHSQYNDYTTTYLARGAIVSVVASDNMPYPPRQGGQAEPVSEEGKKMLLDWVAQGAPEVAGVEPAANIQQEELKPTWISLRNQVFGPKCILCHNDYGPRAGKKKAFNTYRNLRNWFTLNKNLFHFPDDKNLEEGQQEVEFDYGLLVEAVTRDPKGIFEIPMPYNNPFDDLQKDIPQITPEELQVIKKWIELKLPQFEEEL